jgi:hypothetical protein
MKTMDKYYVGAKHIGAAIGRHGHANGYAVPTLEEAIEQAKNTIRDGGAECLVIVKIVAVVRREIPITVEAVE